MSNGTNAPYGFSPYQYLSGAVWNGKVRTYYIAPSTVAIFSGDLVNLSSAGTLSPWTPPGSPGAGLAPLGVFVGCKYVVPGQTVANSTISFSYWPNTPVATGSYILAMVVDDPYVIFKTQSNSASNVVFTNRGYNFEAAQTPGAGNSQSGSSTSSLNLAAITTSATGTLKLIDTPLTDMKANPIWGTTASPIPYQDVLCIINNHFYKPGTAVNLG